MLEGILWLLIAFLILAPGFTGMYLLTSNSDKLTVTYQNYQLRRTMLPLKDEDFANMPTIIRRLKVLGVFMVLFSISVAVFAVMLPKL